MGDSQAFKGLTSLYMRRLCLDNLPHLPRLTAVRQCHVASLDANRRRLSLAVGNTILRGTTTDPHVLLEACLQFIIAFQKSLIRLLQMLQGKRRIKLGLMVHVVTLLQTLFQQLELLSDLFHLFRRSFELLVLHA